MWLETDHFPFMAELQPHWLEIKREVHALGQSDFVPWGQTHMYNHNDGWHVCPLHADIYPLMQPLCDKNRARCPRTAALLERVPGLASAGFSCLLPGTHVTPHVGHDRGCLRSHLGIMIPEGCGMRVGTEVRSWAEGAWLVFDDLTNHEAWNRGTAARVVLMVDFKKSAFGL